MRLQSAVCSLLLFVSVGFSGAGEELITKDYLLSGDWGSEYQVGTKLVFKKDSTYDAFMDYGQDFEKKKGTYSIKDGALNLYLEDGTTAFLTGGRLVRDDASVIYRFCLKFDGGTVVWNKKTIVSEGTRIKIGSTPAITTGRKSGTVTVNAKFRERPDTSSRALACWILKETPDAPEEVQLPYVPAGTVIGILARSENKMKVEKWNNYWYYVEVFDAYRFNAQKAWMFGEFIKPGTKQ
ncbi:MAG TPA: hypothetical protein PLA65_12240 [Spirochaetota bacterium]|nr:hypothetical protein [Spirochaetota bacterium]HOD15235.1 hypothetical protein [Spirochaetota bacterium]HPG49549.1 hypothetical protein [Spirochaetota bacterium]HPN12827.1 hypothetical protein [Spirochaetota bacterium]